MAAASRSRLVRYVPQMMARSRGWVLAFVLNGVNQRLHRRAEGRMCASARTGHRQRAVRGCPVEEVFGAQLTTDRRRRHDASMIRTLIQLPDSVFERARRVAKANWRPVFARGREMSRPPWLRLRRRGKALRRRTCFTMNSRFGWPRAGSRWRAGAKRRAGSDCQTWRRKRRRRDWT